MPTTPISMRKLKEILRLKYGCNLSHRQIARSLSISPSVVSNYANRAAQLGLTDWPLPDAWSDIRLNREFLKTQVKQRKSTLPDWSQVHHELKSKCMTLQLLWEEYAQRHPANHYSYNHYCRLYKQWQRIQRPSMRQNHKAGEKLFVDYCGPTMTVIDPMTGERRSAQIFVATLGASNYTYAEATWSQGLEDWVMSHARCFEFLGGVPDIVVPDNLKSAVTTPCRYEPDINPTYQQLAAHYNVAVMPGRPYKPKDKAKAEVAVQIVERWIMAKLRHETFYSLKALNQHIQVLLRELNNRPMKKHPGSRQQLFEQLDKAVLRPLPNQAYTYTQVKHVRVHLDYHVEVEKHYYSVPHTLLKQKLEAHVTAQLVTIYHQGHCVATHPRSHREGSHTTQTLHMPQAHQQHSQWTPERLEQWARKIGPNTERFVGIQLQSKKHPEQCYRACLGILNLSQKYTNDRLEAACTRAVEVGLTQVKAVKSILEKGLDKQPIRSPQDEQLQTIQHDNIRGHDYYH